MKPLYFALAVFLVATPAFGQGPCGTRVYSHADFYPSLTEVILGLSGEPAILVRGIDPGSAAERSGLQTGDLILGFQHNGWMGRDSLGLRSHSHYRRAYEVLFEEMRHYNSALGPLDIMRYDPDIERYVPHPLQLGTQPISGSELGIRASFTYFILEVSYGSAAQRLGLKAGDFVEKVNGQGFVSAGDLDRLVSAVEATPDRPIFPLSDPMVSHGEWHRGKEEYEAGGGELAVCDKDQTQQGDPAKTREEVLGVKGELAILVTRVTRGSPAERAGLRRGDFIVSFDDQGIRYYLDSQDFLNALRQVVLQDEVALEVLRKDSGIGRYVSLQIPLRLETLSENPLQSFLGIGGIPTYFILEVPSGSVAQRLGLEPGDYVEKINGVYFNGDFDLDGILDAAYRRTGRHVSLYLREVVLLENGLIDSRNERLLEGSL